MKIYTRTGDGGTTALYGGERVPKDALRVEAYGTVDEANALLGLARAQLGRSPLGGDDDVDALLESLQCTLFEVGADLATPCDSKYRANLVPIVPEDAEGLERHIDRLEAELPPLRAFILPGGHPAAASLHLARTVVRRAERRVARLAHEEAVNPHVGVYLNRLSDLLFVLARFVNVRSQTPDTPWRAREQPTREA
jgi:cob(I)alamin adenosyltransferase